MKIFIFKQPKKTILNILFILGITSLVIAFLAIGTVVLWMYYPKTVNKIDKIIPDFYGANIKKLYKKAKESTNEKDSYKYFTELYNTLEEISALNKYYIYRQESSKYLINYYLKKDYQKALRISSKWEKNYPSDFVAKFNYPYILYKINKIKSLKYFNDLYNKYKDIPDVKNQYIKFLIVHKMYDLAFNIHIMQNEYIDVKPSFQIFYIDNKKNVSEKQSIIFNQNNYNVKDLNYILKFKKEFKEFNYIRLDFDNFSNKEIKDIKLSINEINLTIAGINDIKYTSSNRYKIIGEDPYIVFIIPKKLKNFKGILSIKSIIEADEPQSDIYKILNNKEWQIFTSKNNIFTENNSIKFTLNKEFKSSIKKHLNISTQVRIDFPSYFGLKIKDLKININDKIKLNKKDITSVNNIEYHQNKLKIVGDDPFIVIDLYDKIDIKEIDINILFGDGK